MKPFRLSLLLSSTLVIAACAGGEGEDDPTPLTSPSATSFSMTNDLPNGGSSIVPLPINAAGAMQVPDGYGRNLSQIIDIGDLNLDGYGDLLIGYDTGDPANGERTDAGIVWLVSGKAVLDARDRGETFDPRRLLSN